MKPQEKNVTSGNKNKRSQEPMQMPPMRKQRCKIGTPNPPGLHTKH